jgi:hypothetical protein
MSSVKWNHGLGRKFECSASEKVGGKAKELSGLLLIFLKK